MVSDESEHAVLRCRFVPLMLSQRPSRAFGIPLHTTYVGDEALDPESTGADVRTCQLGVSARLAF